MAENYVIGRKVFELAFYDQQEAWSLQTRISYLVRDQLQQLFEQELRRADRSDLHCVLNRLELDLGDVPYDELEQEFPKRFSLALREALPEQLNLLLKGEEADGFVVAQQENKLLLLEQFLSNGQLPWRAGASTTGGPTDWLVQLLRDDSQGLVRMLRRMNKPNHIRRLVLQLTDALLVRIVEVLEPADASFIIRYVADVGKLHRVQPVINQTDTEFRTTQWQVVFTYLLAERGSNFNRRMFMKSTIAGLAAHSNRSYSELLTLLSAAARSTVAQTGVLASLPQLLLELERETWAEHPLPPLQETSSTSRDQEYLQQLRQFLLHGSISPALLLSQLDLMRHTSDLLIRAPQAVATLLRETAHLPGVVLRYLQLTREPARLKTVEVVEPTAAPVIIGFVHTLHTVHQRERNMPAAAADVVNHHWLVVFSYLLIDRGSAFNTRMFVRSTVQQLAAHYNLDYVVLLQFLGKAAQQQQKRQRVPASLPAVLLDLYTETTAVETLAKGEQQTTQLPESTPQQMRDVLQYLLLHGRLPWWALGRWTSSDARELLEHVLREEPESLREILKPLVHEDAAFERLLLAADETVMPQLLTAVPLPETQALDAWLLELDNTATTLFPQSTKRRQLLHLLRGRLLRVAVLHRSGNTELMHWLADVWGELTVRSGNSAAAVFRVLLDTAMPLPAAAQLLLSGLLRQVYDRAGGSVYVDSEQQTPESETLNYIKARQHDEQAQRERLQKALQRAIETTTQKSAVAETPQPISKRANPAEPFAKATLDQLAIAAEAMHLANQLLQDFTAALIAGELSTDTLLPGVLDAVFVAAFGDAWPQLTHEQLVALVAVTRQRLLTTEARRIVPPADTAMLQFVQLILGRETPTPAQLEVLLARLLRTQPKAMQHLLPALLRVNLARHRLVQLLHPATFLRLPGVLAVGRQVVPLPLMADVLELVHRLSPAWVHELRDLLLVLALRMRTQPLTAAAWLQVLLSVAAARTGLKPTALAEQWAAAAARYPEEWKSELPRLLRLLADPYYLPRLADPALRRLQHLREQAAATARREQVKVRETNKRRTPEIDKELGVFITNAGLVLLWPFLTQLFRRCGWLEGMAFTDDAAAGRAVHLLQYLANKQEQAPEYLLVLNKLLCGIASAKPVVKDVVLTDDEKNIGEQLLAAVIQQWTALGKTSVEGLRETFLNRNGQVLFAEQQVVLRVERKAFDKLLGRLPWSLQLIRLPWMQQPLYVEWKT